MRRAGDAPVQLVPGRCADSELEALLSDHALQTLFQPQFEIADGRLVGAEALARLPGAPTSAHALFRRADRAGLAERVSREIQRDALFLAAQWTGGGSDLGLSINVLPQELDRPSYPEWLAATVAEAGIDPRRVTVELTEESTIADMAGAVRRLERLRGLGIRVALDDFGRGFANLAGLAQLPLDVLKLDRSLVRGIEHDEREQKIVRAVIELAHNLGLKLVVEGVETAAQLELLRAWGCDYYQGFLRALPMGDAQFRQFAALHR